MRVCYHQGLGRIGHGVGPADATAVVYVQDTTVRNVYFFNKVLTQIFAAFLRTPRHIV